MNARSLPPTVSGRQANKVLMKTALNKTALEKTALEKTAAGSIGDASLTARPCPAIQLK